MARLMDALLAHKFRHTPYANAIEALPNAEVLDVSNVAHFYFEVSEKIKWSMVDFPTLAPPFETFFMEFNGPRKLNLSGKFKEAPPYVRQTEMGCLFLVEDALHLPQDTATERLRMRDTMVNRFGLRWTYTCVPFLRSNGRIAEPVASWGFLVKADGSVIVREDGEAEFNTAIDKEMAARVAAHNGLTLTEVAETYRDLSCFVLDPCLLAISLMHCKNVTLEPHEPPPAVDKAHQRRQGRPLVRYHTLMIEPMKRVLRSEGQMEKTGLKNALHICRAHFKDFREGGGLFGRHKGLYFWASQVRGSLEAGVVDKDYAVNAPAGTEAP